MTESGKIMSTRTPQGLQDLFFQTRILCVRNSKRILSDRQDHRLVTTAVLLISKTIDNQQAMLVLPLNRQCKFSKMFYRTKIKVHILLDGYHGKSNS